MGFREKFKFSRRTTILALLGASLALGGGAYWYYSQNSGSPNAEGGKGNQGKGGPGGNGRRFRFGGGPRVQPVKAVDAKRGDLDVVLTALGTVTASNTAVIKPRVDGQLIKVRFRESQLVKAGDVLAEIDPRPYQILVDQAHGQLLKDQALLSNAKVDLDRYRGLLAKDSIARQQVEAQEALVSQYQGVVETDKAQEANARLQLSFTHITAPAAGRLGLRQADAGNMVHASDANGIVVITQTQPINVVFSIPADNVGSVVNYLQEGKTRLSVEIRDRDGKVILATGKLISADNQIDVTTGTVKLKAEFPNKDNKLFPNQFVNAFLKVETRHDAVLLPSAAIQRNTRGTFVFVVNREEQTVDIRQVVLGPTSGDTVVIEKGLEEGEQVVLDGTDRLRPGAKIEVVVEEERPRGDGEGRRRRKGGQDGAAEAPRSDAAAESKPGENGKGEARAEGSARRDRSGEDKPAGGAKESGERSASRGDRPARGDETDAEREARRERFRKMRESGEFSGGRPEGARGDWTPPKDETDAERQARRERFRKMREAAEGGSPDGAPRRRSE